MADPAGEGGSRLNLTALGVGAAGLTTVIAGLSTTGTIGRIIRNDPEVLAARARARPPRCRRTGRRRPPADLGPRGDIVLDHRARTHPRRDRSRRARWCSDRARAPGAALGEREVRERPAPDRNREGGDPDRDTRVVVHRRRPPGDGRRRPLPERHARCRPTPARTAKATSMSRSTSRCRPGASTPSPSTAGLSRTRRWPRAATTPSDADPTATPRAPRHRDETAEAGQASRAWKRSSAPRSRGPRTCARATTTGASRSIRAPARRPRSAV